MSESLTLAGLCLAATLGQGAERAETTTHAAIAIQADGRTTLALATLPQAWRKGDPVLLLVARAPGGESWRDHAAASVLPWGVAVVDWPGWLGLDAADGVRAVAETLEPGAIAAVEAVRPSGALRLALAGDEAGDDASPLACALDALVAARGHDALAP